MTTSSPPSIKAAATTLLLFGAGGHGRVLADAALGNPAWLKILASDRNPQMCHGELLPGVKLVLPETVLSLPMAVHVAIGNNLAREREASFWGAQRLVSIVHAAAVVSRFSQLGAGSFVAAGAVVAPGAMMGVGVIVNHAAVVDHDVQIGDFSHIAPHVTLGGAVVVGRRVLLGAGAVVLPSVQIVDDVIVGAGAVVTANIVQSGTYAGVPARRIK